MADSTVWRKHGTGCALNKQDSVRIDHARTRSCTSRSRSVTDIRLPKTTFLALLDYCNAFDRVWREDLLFRAKASRWHRHSGCATSSPSQKPKCRSTETKAKSYHYARDSLNDPSCHRSPSCCTSTTFGESYQKTWKWPCLPTTFHSSATTTIKKSLKQ